MTEKINLATMRYFDNTRLSDHRGCNRFFYLRHELGWAPLGKALPLAFGGSWHAAMDVVWEAVCLNGLCDVEEISTLAYNEGFLKCWTEDYGLLPDMAMDPTDVQANEPRTTSIAHEMLINYVSQRLEFLQSIELIEIELPFAVPLAPDREDFMYVGRIDKVFCKDGDIWVGEHKTSSMYAKNGYFRSNVVDSFSPNSQIDGYIYSLSMMLGEKVRGVMVDLALVHKTVHEGFLFVPVIRDVKPLNAWLYDAQEETRKVFENLVKLENIDPEQRASLGFLAAFPKNTNNCQGKYGPCMYKEICQFADDPITIIEHEPERVAPHGFEVKVWEPFEFNKLSTLGALPERENS